MENFVRHVIFANVDNYCILWFPVTKYELNDEMGEKSYAIFPKCKDWQAYTNLALPALYILTFTERPKIKLSTADKIFSSI